VTLRDKPFEKAARRRVLEEVRRSEAMRAEYRLARKAARSHSRLRAWLSRSVWMILVLTIIGRSGFSTVSKDFIIAVTLLWTVGMMFWRAVVLRSLLYNAANLLVFDYLPISANDIFTVQWRRFLRGAWWTALHFTVAYTLLLARSECLWHALAGGAVLGLVQCVFVNAAAVCLVAFASPKRVAQLALPFLAAALALIFFGATQTRLLAWLSGLAWYVPPMGWILQSLGFSESNGLLHNLIPPVMAVALLALAPIAFRRARQAYNRSEPIALTDGRTPEMQEFAKRHEQTPGDARAAIQSREFLAGVVWKKTGFIERLASRLLNARQLLVAEFLVAANPRWTRQLWGLVWVFLLFMVAAWFFGPDIRSAAGMMILLSVVFALVLFAQTWRGFGMPQQGGLQSPYYALYPIGFWELIGVVMKINILRICFLLPFMMAAAFLSGGTSDLRADAVSTGLKIIALLLIGQPLLALAPISPGTNDTRKATFVAVVFVCLLALLSAAIVFFMATRLMVLAISGCLGAALSALVLVLYGRWFNRSEFDLVPLEKTNPGL
jgi:hypothetical protein